MKLLLDTNVFLRWFLEPERLDPSWPEAINSAEQAYLSVLSMMEIGILYNKNRLQISGEPSAFVLDGMNALQLMPLSVTPQHALATIALPRHHGDPVDRLLIAQARCERLTLMTSDRVIPKYDVPVFGHKARRVKGG